ncbi:hypothetical protein CDG81_18040 [Actinopolyspora erythraea]|uniref:Uncharacterized protein n=1 Tax=Actinopolyspora erythraea TaxID=414996 RepID=A0A099D2U1_9ACTN|nr:hypothetical protein [Actinopolyspora erythraea]ASU79846.1 hypothetical protein CDG81_18040 [Actinopolyspora erythraea]KGI79635.1 hypothetical protein IL38_22020 [Actinopolyspora erythraea]
MSDAAHELGWRRYSPQQCHDTAVAFEEFTTALREHAQMLPSGELPASGQSTQPTVVEENSDA